MMYRGKLCLLTLLLAALCTEGSNLRAAPQSVKQHKAAKVSSTKRATYQTGYDALQTEVRKAALLYAQQQQQQQQQQGSWVGIASVQAVEPTRAVEATATARAKPEPAKHKHKHPPKPHRHTRRDSQSQNEDHQVEHEHELYKQQQDKAFAEQLKFIAAPKVGRSPSIGDGLSQPPSDSKHLPDNKGAAPAPAEPQTDNKQQQQTRSSDSFWHDDSSSSSSSSSSTNTGDAPDGGSDKDSSSRSSRSSRSSSSSSSAAEDPASIGRITQFNRVLKISYEGAAGDSGVAPDASVAAATLEWSLSASSPNFDNAPKAQADGSYGHWQLTVDQEVPFVSAKKEAFIRFEGNASYPKQIIMRGKLSSVMATLPVTAAPSTVPSTRSSSQGEVPGTFVSSMQQKFTVTACEYSGPCNWQQPNMGPLLGRLTVTPSITGSHSIRDLVGRKWLPDGLVEVVCALDPHQEDLVDCPTGSEGSTGVTMRVPV